MELLPNRNKKTGKFIKGKVSLDNCMCITCGKGFHVPPYRLKVEVKYCSRKCKGMGWDTLGENHPAWKGGIELTKEDIF